MKRTTQAMFTAGCLFAMSVAAPLATTARAGTTVNPFAKVFATEPSRQVNGAAAKNDVYSITMLARDTRFIPSVLKVKAGSKIQIRFRNEGKEPHNITFRSLPYRSTTIQSGQETTFTMFAPAPGRYPFYCSVGNHAELGMTGMFKVSR